MNYRKLIKKIGVALLSATFLFMPVNVMAEEREVQNIHVEWKSSAIVSPTKGQLVAAGPIRVEFKQLHSTDIDIVSYDLYLDGELKNTFESSDQDTLVGEVYTTEVSSHNVQVVAVTLDGKKINSNIRLFFVSKKGISVDNKPGQVEYPIEDMNQSWCYNWSTEPYEYNDTNCEFIPMVWNNNANSIQWLLTAKENGFNTVLGFNEPDLIQQAHLTVDEAVEYYDDFKNSRLRVGAPVIAYNHGWLGSYMNEINNDVDFIPMHVYMHYPGKTQVKWVISQIESMYNQYQKPIWITEVSFYSNDPYWNGLVSGNESIQPMVNEALKMLINGVEPTAGEEGFLGLDALNYVERYAWFSFDTLHTYGGVSSLYETNSHTELNKGELTELGKLYKDLGNPDMNVNTEDVYVQDDIADYRQLHMVINAATNIILSDNYVKGSYQDTSRFNLALNATQEVSQDLAWYQQDIIDQLTIDLQNEISLLKLKSADYSSLNQLVNTVKEYLKDHDCGEQLMNAFDEARALNSHLSINDQSTIDEAYIALKKAFEENQQILTPETDKNVDLQKDNVDSQHKTEVVHTYDMNNVYEYMFLCLLSIYIYFMIKRRKYPFIK